MTSFPVIPSDGQVLSHDVSADQSAVGAVQTMEVVVTGYDHLVEVVEARRWLVDRVTAAREVPKHGQTAVSVEHRITATSTASDCSSRRRHGVTRPRRSTDSAPTDDSLGLLIMLLLLGHDGGRRADCWRRGVVIGEEERLSPQSGPHEDLLEVPLEFPLSDNDRDESLPGVGGSTEQHSCR